MNLISCVVFPTSSFSDRFIIFTFLNIEMNVEHNLNSLPPGESPIAVK